MTQEKIRKLEFDIDEAEREYQTFLKLHDAELEKATKRRDEKVALLQAERSTTALGMKLADYPAELIDQHKTCEICGAEMRPYTIAKRVGKENKVVKLWACQAGNLSEDHDLIPVE
jgi:hypothetical protein